MQVLQSGPAVPTDSGIPYLHNPPPPICRPPEYRGSNAFKGRV